MNKATHEMLSRLERAGISANDAAALRRISMTLQRWHELECGDGNEYGSWAIERDDNGDGAPFMVHHHYRHGRGADSTTRTRIPDRERGARKRLAAIMARYDGFAAYVQTDPRGAALYVLTPDMLATLAPDVAASMRPTLDLSAVYSRGIAVYK